MPLQTHPTNPYVAGSPVDVGTVFVGRDGVPNEVPSQKWMNFYMKVLPEYATGKGSTLRVQVEIAPKSGISEQSIEATRSALQELGLGNEAEVE